MKNLKHFVTLPAIALAAGMTFAGAASALAAQSQPAPAATAAVQGPLAAADYVWNGHHYVYRWHGRYFNHRRWHNKQWDYY